MSALIVPRLDLTLRPGWKRLPSPGGPLTWGKGSDDSLGALQASIPSNADLLAAEPDLQSRAAAMGKFFGFTDVEDVAGGPCSFGKYGAATMSGGEFKFFRIWVLVSDKPAVTVFTWISDRLDPDEADAIVLSARPAEDVPDTVRSVVLDGARKSLEQEGQIVPGVLVLGKGILKMLPVTARSDDDLPAFAEFVREEAAKSQADAVAVIAGAQVRGEDGATKEAVGVYIETRKARQAYVLPLERRGFLRRRLQVGQHYEVIPDEEDPLRNFFSPSQGAA